MPYTVLLRNEPARGMLIGQLKFIPTVRCNYLVYFPQPKPSPLFASIITYSGGKLEAIRKISRAYFLRPSGNSSHGRPSLRNARNRFGPQL